MFSAKKKKIHQSLGLLESIMCVGILAPPPCTQRFQSPLTIGNRVKKGGVRRDLQDLLDNVQFQPHLDERNWKVMHTYSKG